MNPPLPIDGVLPPDLQGTLIRIGPGAQYGASVEVEVDDADWAGGWLGEDAARQGPPARDVSQAGALHAIEIRDGVAISYRTSPSSANANVFWQAGKVLALAESALPQQFSRLLQPEEFDGGLSVPIASHVHRDSATGGRILFGAEQGTETAPPFLRIGEWDSVGALTHQMEVQLERATWQHDIGITARHIVFIESPTEYSAYLGGEDPDDQADVAVPYRWTPGAQGWIGLLSRDGDGSDVRWIPVDPCLVTHVLHAYDEADGAHGDGDAVVLYVCRYDVPEPGQPVDFDSSVIDPAGIGMSLIAHGLPVLERWRIQGERLERTQVDDRLMEYPTSDPICEGRPFRYGYSVEMAPNEDRSVDRMVDHLGLLRLDMARDEVASWSPGQYRTASEPLFVRAGDGRSDDEGWLLTMVYDAAREASDLYVLDASSFGRRSPQAVIHLPGWATLPFRSHGTWIGADRYR